MNPTGIQHIEGKPKCKHICTTSKSKGKRCGMDAVLLGYCIRHFQHNY